MTHPFMENYQPTWLPRHRDIPIPVPVHGATGRAFLTTAVLIATVGSAVRAAEQAAPDLPYWQAASPWAPKTSQAVLNIPRRRARLGVLWLSASPANRPGTKPRGPPRENHIPMLSCKEPRYPGDLKLLRPSAQIRRASYPAIIETADHSFHILKVRKKPTRTCYNDWPKLPSRGRRDCAHRSALVDGAKLVMTFPH